MKRLFAAILVFLALFAAAPLAEAQEQGGPRFKAVAFDFFVLSDPNSVVPEVEKAFPGKGADFTRLWRSKQFEYCFLRSLAGRHEDFFKVTEDALAYSAKAMGLELTPEARTRLLNAYLALKPWPDALEALRKLKAAGVRIIALSNFTPKMLEANAKGSGMAELFDELLSTEINASFKPEPRAYELGVQRLNLRKDQILFAAFGAWDAYGAKSFGYPTYWVNRFNLPAEELGIKPDKTSPDLAGLLAFVLGRP
jgi:2-haloacid dehalogenase